MFLEIESSRLVNLSQITHIDLHHRADRLYAMLYVGSFLVAESRMAYAYLMNQAKAAHLMLQNLPVEEPTPALVA